MLTASDRESEEYFTAQAYSKEIARTRGLEHIFERHNLDAAIFAMELGVPQCFVSAGGYAAVSFSSTIELTSRELLLWDTVRMGHLSEFSSSPSLKRWSC